MAFKDFIEKKTEIIFDIFDRKKSIVISLLIIGVLLTAESFIFIYTTYEHWFSHISIYILFIFFIAGVADLLLIVLYTRSRGFELTDTGKYESMAPYLQKLDRYIHFSNVWISTSMGFVIALFALTHSIFGIGSSPRIGDADILLFLFGASVFFYSLVPVKYSIERDFIVSFLGILIVFMGVIPLLFYALGSNFKYYFLTLPVHHMLDLIGVSNKVLTPSRIEYYHNNIPGVIIIAKSCSGIYSFSIFTSAFISFALVVYRKMDVKVILFMILGTVLAYIGNVVRMTIVIASGHYYGAQTMTWVHENVGYIIFFAWMGFFWFLLYKFLMKGSKTAQKTED